MRFSCNQWGNAEFQPYVCSKLRAPSTDMATRLYANVQRTSGPTHTAQPTHLVMHLRWKVSGPVHCLGNGRLCRWRWRLWWSNDVITEPGSAQDRPPLTGPTVRILQHAHGLVGLSSEIGMGRYGQFFTLWWTQAVSWLQYELFLKCLVKKRTTNDRIMLVYL